MRAKDFARVVGGGTPKNASDPANFDPNGTPWLTPADLSGYARSTIGTGRRSLSQLGLRNSASRTLPAGTVLVSSRAPVGYCAVAANEVCTNQGFRSLLCDDSVDPFFIRYYVLYSRAYLEDNASGTTFKELSGSALGGLIFPIPTIDSQRRIVARIDELFGELDDGETALALARNELETYRKALLKAAVTGELTADWRAANPPDYAGGDPLGRRILADNATSTRSRTARKPESVGVVENSWPSLPSGWCYASLESLLADEPNALTDGPFGSKLKSEHYRDAGPRVVRLQNIGKLGQFVDARAHISAEHFDSLAKHHVEAGDLVVAILGETAPRAALIPESFGLGLVKADCFKIRLDERIGKHFVWAWLNSSIVQGRLASAIKGVGRPRIGMQNIRTLPVPVPPPEERDELETTLAWALASQAEQLAAVTEFAENAQILRQSILAAAFRGDLVQ